jgi:glycosyltransferase involved in cell wall biosynthesis
MKITHVIWGLRYGGAETMLVDIVNQQCSKHDVSVLIINDSEDENLVNKINPAVKIIRINRPPGSKNPWHLLRLNATILFSKSDVIHFHQDNIIKYLPIRFFQHNFYLTVHSVALDANSVKKYDQIFAISEAVEDSIYQQTVRKSTVVYNGIDVKRFNTTKRTTNLDTFRMVQLGRLDHFIKGQHLSLMALHQLVYQYKNTSVHLDFIGEGASEEYLKQLVKELNLTDYVTFLGNQTTDYIKENLSSYDLAVQPSLWEGFGLTIVEAMAAMTPTLISNVDGMQTVSQNGTLSYTFVSEDVDDYAKKLDDIVRCPLSERKEIAKKAYSYILEDFDISSTVENYQKLYELYSFI